MTGKFCFPGDRLICYTSEKHIPLLTSITAYKDTDPQLVQFPCLIIEVLSPSTEAADRGKKFAKYRQSPTLQEYVLVQVAQSGVEVFRRNEQGKWVLSEYSLDERLRLESVDVEIAIAHLYRQVQFETEVTDA